MYAMPIGEMYMKFFRKEKLVGKAEAYCGAKGDLWICTFNPDKDPGLGKIRISKSEYAAYLRGFDMARKLAGGSLEEGEIEAGCLVALVERPERAYGRALIKCDGLMISYDGARDECGICSPKKPCDECLKTRVGSKLIEFYKRGKMSK